MSINSEGKLVEMNADGMDVEVHIYVLKEKFGAFFKDKMQEHQFPSTQRGFKGRFGVQLFGRVIYFFRVVTYNSQTIQPTLSHQIQYNDDTMYDMSEEQLQLSLLAKSYEVPVYVKEAFKALDKSKKAEEIRKRKRNYSTGNQGGREEK